MSNLVTIHDLTYHTVDTMEWSSDCPSATSDGIPQGIPRLLSPTPIYVMRQKVRSGLLIDVNLEYQSNGMECWLLQNISK